MKTDKTMKAMTTKPTAKAPARQDSVKVAPVQAATATATTPVATARHEISPELIAARAYNIWEQEGRPQGHEVANWLLAETQLKREQSFTA